MLLISMLCANANTKRGAWLCHHRPRTRPHAHARAHIHTHTQSAQATCNDFVNRQPPEGVRGLTDKRMSSSPRAGAACGALGGLGAERAHTLTLPTRTATHRVPCLVHAPRARALQQGNERMTMNVSWVSVRRALRARGAPAAAARVRKEKNYHAAPCGQLAALIRARTSAARRKMQPSVTRTMALRPGFISPTAAGARGGVGQRQRRAHAPSIPPSLPTTHAPAARRRKAQRRRLSTGTQRANECCRAK